MSATGDRSAARRRGQPSSTTHRARCNRPSSVSGALAWGTRTSWVCGTFDKLHPTRRSSSLSGPSRCYQRPRTAQRPHLARLAPSHHPDQRRPRVPDPATAEPKIPCAGMTLYAVLRRLQHLLARLIGTCPTCRTHFPQRLRRAGPGQSPTRTRSRLVVRADSVAPQPRRPRQSGDRAIERAAPCG